MSNRQLVIDSCRECPFFDNEYYEYMETCTKLKRVIPQEKKRPYRYVIPDDCPLPKTDAPADQ